jgi:hypothetical protein
MRRQRVFPPIPHTSYSGGRMRATITYQSLIRNALRARSAELDPRHVEAWLRSENRDLSALNVDQFAREVDLAIRLVASHGPRQSEQLALSFGL